MKKLTEIVLGGGDDDCGCDDKKTSTGFSLKKESVLSEGMQYHIYNQLPLCENIYRPETGNFFKLFREARELYKSGNVEFLQQDVALLETDLGEFGDYEGIQVPLDYPITVDYLLRQGEYQGKKVQIGKPKRGGSKKFYVFVRNPKTGKIIKVSFGDTSGLKAKINDPKARQAFSKRHNCPDKKDKTKPSYWSCRLPRYAKLLGMKTTFSGYW